MEEHSSVVLRIGAKADRGHVREENQDRISRIQSPFGDVFVVADGMGGHEGGATAAQMLIDGLDEHLRGLPPGTPPEAALQEAAARTNAHIYRLAQGGDPRLAKMGATCVLALISGSRAWIAHAGDSRAYLWRGGRLTQLTRDHTLVQGMLDRQILNEEEARDHPDANVVTRAFGQKPEVELEVAPPRDLYDGDRLLLCSDGLSGYVGDDAIARVLAAGGDAQPVTDALIDLALQAGGEDNVSVQLIAVQGGAAPAVAAPPMATPPPVIAEPPAPAPRRGLPGFLLVLPLILVAFLAGMVLPWRAWLQPGTPEAKQEDLGTDLATAEPHESTDPVAEMNSTGSETGPEFETVPLGTDLGKGSEESVPTGEPLAPEPPETKKKLEIVLLATKGDLEPRLSGLGKVSVEAPIKPFKEGHVYFREGYEKEADKIVLALGSKGGKYVRAPWPAGYSYFTTAGVLVAARRPQGSAGATAPTPPPPPPSSEIAPAPRVAILSPEGAELSEDEKAVLKSFLGEVPASKPLEGKLAGVLKEGSVYFRPGLDQQGKELAEKLGYNQAPWPPDVALELDKTSLLVIPRRKTEPPAPANPGGEP